jgi:hypothetical protein
MPLISGLGGVGGFLSGSNFNISDYFRTTSYTGNGTALTVSTGINLLANPGMVMFGVNQATVPWVYDTVRGAGNLLQVGLTAAQSSDTGQGLISFNANGLSLGNYSAVNPSALTATAWSIRKHPKLFNVLTYAGNNTPRSIPHGLSSKPGLIIIKTLGTRLALMWHKGLTAGKYITWDGAATGELSIGDELQAGVCDNTNVYIGADTGTALTNTAGETLVMYVYADDPTGYIQSGTYVGNGSTTGPIINLGWEPQWLLIKARNGKDNWVVYDNVRGFGSNKLWAATAYDATAPITSSTTGFRPNAALSVINTASSTYLYTAIRK